MNQQQQKVEIPYSYAFINFISDVEKEKLIEWAHSCFDELKVNGGGRYFNLFSKLKFVPPLVYEIKKRVEHIIERDYVYDPIFEDFLSFNLHNAAIHPHADPNLDGYTHTRYNLILSLPEQGGLPIYNESLVNVAEKMLWRCEAGKYTHESTPVRGSKPRINLSFGFQEKNQ